MRVGTVSVTDTWTPERLSMTAALTFVVAPSRRPACDAVTAAAVAELSVCHGCVCETEFLRGADGGQVSGSLKLRSPMSERGILHGGGHSPREHRQGEGDEHQDATAFIPKTR
jgi:hypothetical protein